MCSKCSSMIKLDSCSEKFYFCTTADWSVVVKAKDQNQAATEALKLGMEVFKEDALVSPCLRVKKINEEFENSDILIRIDQIFADIGMHKESAEMSKLIKNLQS